MSYYPKEEQETLYLYDATVKHWKVHSTFPPHIRKLLDYATVNNTEKDKEGRVILVVGNVDRNQVRLFKPRL
ncbi:hypothetical protein [Halobacillus mangrovi]|uniref:Uncharacterized protein n=1 Tax=Halobacillus mangrovi TaxID=402384 RepID=A0A1W5ZY12_9BACI|nr:hypothetical protein [Halobacillus mangrovi]ARI78236.1 hypothetical protein HM131_15865 [Halobacillus mangrovi]